ncbi:MAG: hypothetical protein JSU98_00950 [Gemmatimonadales bacterium]|jgi:hypothetical protein|nr:MAG: hypothetical protein JSU98_00950 [Gemmatimonadales bacterium]
MRSFVHFIPIITTIVALFFAPRVYARWKERRPAPHLLWWSAGILLFGVGTFTEAFTTLFGWNEGVFRAWYISGALLGGAPLAQGTVYLLLSKKTADRLTVVLVAFVAVASVGVLMTPIDMAAVETHRLTGSVMEWQRVRLFSPFINTYAFVFLVGGAALSAWRFRTHAALKHRFIGNVFIAVGALLPGIGGMATRMGHTEVLYVMELVGLLMIWTGYRYNVSPQLAGVDQRRAKEAGEETLAAS